MLSNSIARLPWLIASAMRNTSLFPMVAFGASPSDDVAVSWGIFFSSTAAMRSNAALIFRAVSAASDLVIGVARSRCDTTRSDIRGSKERYGDVQSFAYEMQTLHAKLKICMHLLSVGFMRREATDGFMRLLSKVRRPLLYTDTKDSHTLHALTPLALPPRITYIEFMSNQRSLSQTTNVCLPTSTTGRTHIPFPPRTRPDMHHASTACSGQSRQRRHRRSLSPPPYPLTFHHQDTFESSSHYVISL